MQLKNFFKKKIRKIGLTLGGGGAKGLCHIAFLKAFDDMNIKPSIISGTSIGALIGALYCSGLSGREIEDIFTKLTLLEMSKLIDVSWKTKHGLVKGNKLIRFLNKIVQHKHFEDLNIPLKIVATDFWKRSEVILDKGNLIDAVRASFSIPGILEPVVIKDKVLIDGGAVNPLPYAIIQEESDFIIAIDVLGGKIPQRGFHEKPNLFEGILSTFQIMETAIVENKLMFSQPDLYIKPKLINFRVLEFYRAKEIINAVNDDVLILKNELNNFI